MIKKKIIVSLSAVLVSAAVILLFCLYNGFVWFNNPGRKHFPVRGIDVSHHQKSIDWAKVSHSGIHFAYIKATEGKDFRDTLFEHNWRESGKAGVKRGAYHFFTFRSSGRDQARHIIDVVPKEEGTLPPAIDLEFGGNSRNIPSRTDLAVELKECLRMLESHYGVKPVIYATYEAYEEYLTGEYHQYPLWIRDIFRKPDLKDGRNWVIWQYSNRGRMKGIPVYVDQNVFRGSRQELEEIVLQLPENE
ncbi:MAG: GH25 family lysozyme [Chitinispirillaceae bacterium]